MTLWAFVSDIHGNRRALDRAEAHAREAGAECFVCLGDVIGRGDPEGCIRWVQQRATPALVGNRDLDHLDWVCPDLQSVVLSWPREARASDFVATHGDRKFHRVLHSGSAADGFRRVFSLMAEEGLRLWFFGHTHQARMWRLSAQPSGERASLLLPSPSRGGGGGERLEGGSQRVVLESGLRYVVNVGTTGLPLAGRGGPSIALYDDTAGWVEIVGLG